MGKFVARTFIPGELANDDNAYAFDSAWAAWDALSDQRLKAEAEALGLVVGTESDTYAPTFYSAWGDMNELAQPEAYDEEGCFGVASSGTDWLGSKGVGTIWGPTPGLDRLDDKGICYQVSWETMYVGL